MITIQTSLCCGGSPVHSEHERVQSPAAGVAKASSGVGWTLAVLVGSPSSVLSGAPWFAQLWCRWRYVLSQCKGKSGLSINRFTGHGFCVGFPAVWRGSFLCCWRPPALLRLSTVSTQMYQHTHGATEYEVSPVVTPHRRRYAIDTEQLGR